MVDVAMAAPAPGSPEEASFSAEGARGDWVPSPATRIGAQGKGVAFFADVHRKAKNGDVYRITYTVDGLTFKHVDSFTDIPAKDGDMVFVDILPIQHTDGAIELLRRGVEVYCLRRLTLVKKKREELRLTTKTTRSDIKALMSIEEKWFRRVSEDFLVMRRMIAAYRTLQKTHQQLVTKYKAVSDIERYTIKPAIRTVEEQMDELAKKISEEAGRRYPAYNRLVDELGIRGNISAMEALAEILTYIDPLKGFRKTANLFGLFKPIRGRMKIYNGHLRKALQRLTSSVNSIRVKQLTARLEKQTLYKVWKTYIQETRGRPAIPAQG